jgi:hypothetical protein
MGSFRNVILILASVSIAIGVYLYFLSSDASNFFSMGDLEKSSYILFFVGGILIIVWIFSGLLKKEDL